MLNKINLGTCLMALILFAFPWVDIQCSKQTMATQTGFQLANGQVTAVDPVTGNASESSGGTYDGDSPNSAPLVGFAFLAIIAAMVCSSIAIFRNLRLFETLGFALPAVALGLLLSQLAVELPVKKSLKESIVEQSTDNASLDDPFSGMGNSSNALMMSSIQVKMSPAFYLELIVLGIPVLMLAGTLLRRVQKTTVSSPPDLP